MKYDFIEIGTSNFRTLIEKADTVTNGISIEPIKYYLDKLPSKPNVLKLNIAISTDNMFGQGLVFYIPENIIKEKNLKKWMRGCNCIDKYHLKHRGLEEYVVKEKIEKVPLFHIFEKYNIEELDHLKIDTEGSDSDILLSFIDFLKNQDTKMYPKEITFETNRLSPEIKVAKVIQEYTNLGYKIKEKRKADTVLTL